RERTTIRCESATSTHLAACLIRSRRVWGAMRSSTRSGQPHPKMQLLVAYVTVSQPQNSTSALVRRRTNNRRNRRCQRTIFRSVLPLLQECLRPLRSDQLELQTYGGRITAAPSKTHRRLMFLVGLDSTSVGRRVSSPATRKAGRTLGVLLVKTSASWQSGSSRPTMI